MKRGDDRPVPQGSSADKNIDRSARLKRQQRELRDRRILDRAAKSLNAETLDVLEFQTGR